VITKIEVLSEQEEIAIDRAADKAATELFGDYENLDSEQADKFLEYKSIFAKGMRTGIMFERFKKEKDAKLLEVVEFYADPNNWNADDKGVGDRITISDVGIKSEQGYHELSVPSGGRRAREVLRELRKGTNNAG
jgi:hypothetical protein